MACLFRYREISFQSNSRYLNALAHVDDPAEGVLARESITTRKKTVPTRPVKPERPLSRPDAQLITELMNGGHALHGFTNRDLGDRLSPSALRLHVDPESGAPRSAGSCTGFSSIESSQRSRDRAVGGSPTSASA